MKIVLTALEGEAGQETIPVLVDARCATCRWAVATAAWRGDEFYDADDQREWSLACNRVHAGGSPFIGYDADHGSGARVLVQPSFGCTEWQAKDSPAPETP